MKFLHIPVKRLPLWFYVGLVAQSLIFGIIACGPKDGTPASAISLPEIRDIPNSNPNSNPGTHVNNDANPNRNPSIPYAKAVQALYDQKEFQEASWVAEEEGYPKDGADIRKQIETRMKTDSYVEFKPSGFTGVGVASKKFLKFSSGFSGIFKPTDGPTAAGNYSYWESEVATYLFDQLLGLNVVPLTIEFTLTDGTKGSLQYMVDVKGLSMTTGGGNSAVNLQSMEVLDYLIGNVDRNNKLSNYNWFYWPGANRVVAFDHGLAFQDREAGCFVPGTNELYVGFLDEIRGGPIQSSGTYYVSGTGYVTACSLQALTKSTGGLAYGVTDHVDFSKLDTSVKARIKTVSDTEVHKALDSYVHSSVQPGYKMDLNALLTRLHRLQNAL